MAWQHGLKIKLLWAAGGFLLASLLFQGCSQKKDKAPLPPSQVAAPEQLPELPQNYIYKTNRPADEPTPDPSAELISNDLQPPPADAEPSPQID